MANKFNLYKTTGDVNVGTPTSPVVTDEITVTFDPKRKIIIATAWLRGDDYDSDANHPTMSVWMDSVKRSEIELTPDVLKSVRYSKHEISWDPKVKDNNVNCAKDFDFSGDDVVIVMVFDENGTNCGVGSLPQQTYDLSPVSHIISPTADGVEGSAFNTIEVHWRPEKLFWMQKYEPRIAVSIKEDMSGPVYHDMDEFLLKGTSTWINWDESEPLMDLSNTPWAYLDVDWDKDPIYWNEIAEMRVTGLSIDAYDVNQQLFFEIDYRGITL